MGLPFGAHIDGGAVITSSQNEDVPAAEHWENCEPVQPEQLEKVAVRLSLVVSSTTKESGGARVDDAPGNQPEEPIATLWFDQKAVPPVFGIRHSVDDIRQLAAIHFGGSADPRFVGLFIDRREVRRDEELRNFVEKAVAAKKAAKKATLPAEGSPEDQEDGREDGTAAEVVDIKARATFDRDRQSWLDAGMALIRYSRLLEREGRVNSSRLLPAAHSPAHRAAADRNKQRHRRSSGRNGCSAFTATSGLDSEYLSELLPPYEDKSSIPLDPEAGRGRDPKPGTNKSIFFYSPRRLEARRIKLAAAQEEDEARIKQIKANEDAAACPDKGTTTLPNNEYILTTFLRNTTRPNRITHSKAFIGLLRERIREQQSEACEDCRPQHDELFTTVVEIEGLDYFADHVVDPSEYDLQSEGSKMWTPAFTAAAVRHELQSLAGRGHNIDKLLSVSTEDGDVPDLAENNQHEELRSQPSWFRKCFVAALRPFLCSRSFVVALANEGFGEILGVAETLRRKEMNYTGAGGDECVPNWGYDAEVTLACLRSCPLALQWLPDEVLQPGTTGGAGAAAVRDIFLAACTHAQPPHGRDIVEAPRILMRALSVACNGAGGEWKALTAERGNGSDVGEKSEVESYSTAAESNSASACWPWRNPSTGSVASDPEVFVAILRTVGNVFPSTLKLFLQFAHQEQVLANRDEFLLPAAAHAPRVILFAPLAQFLADTEASKELLQTAFAADEQTPIPGLQENPLESLYAKVKHERSEYLREVGIESVLGEQKQKLRPKDLMPLDTIRLLAVKAARAERRVSLFVHIMREMRSDVKASRTSFAKAVKPPGSRRTVVEDASDIEPTTANIDHRLLREMCLLAIEAEPLLLVSSVGDADVLPQPVETDLGDHDVRSSGNTMKQWFPVPAYLRFDKKFVLESLLRTQGKAYAAAGVGAKIAMAKGEDQAPMPSPSSGAVKLSPSAADVNYLLTDKDFSTAAVRLDPGNALEHLPPGTRARKRILRNRELLLEILTGVSSEENALAEARVPVLRHYAAVEDTSQCAPSRPTSVSNASFLAIDREIALAAVSLDYRNLEFVGEELLNHHDVVVAAMVNRCEMDARRAARKDQGVDNNYAEVDSSSATVVSWRRPEELPDGDAHAPWCVVALPDKTRRWLDNLLKDKLSVSIVSRGHAIATALTIMRRILDLPTLLQSEFQPAAGDADVAEKGPASSDESCSSDSESEDRSISSASFHGHGRACMTAEKVDVENQVADDAQDRVNHPGAPEGPTFLEEQNQSKTDEADDEGLFAVAAHQQGDDLSVSSTLGIGDEVDAAEAHQGAASSAGASAEVPLLSHAGIAKELLANWFAATFLARCAEHCISEWTYMVPGGNRRSSSPGARTSTTPHHHSEDVETTCTMFADLCRDPWAFCVLIFRDAELVDTLVAHGFPLCSFVARLEPLLLKQLNAAATAAARGDSGRSGEREEINESLIAEVLELMPRGEKRSRLADMERPCYSLAFHPNWHVNLPKPKVATPAELLERIAQLENWRGIDSRAEFLRRFRNRWRASSVLSVSREMISEGVDGGSATASGDLDDQEEHRVEERQCEDAGEEET